MIEALNKAILCWLFSVICRLANRMQVITNKIHQIHLSTEWDRCNFPEISTDFVFQNLPEEIQSKIIYFYSVINEYSLHSWDVHFVPSWHKWSGFEYRPWCLVIVVRAPPDNSLNLCKTWKTCIFKTAFHVKQYITSSFYLSFNRSWAMINHSLCSVHVYV